ncbi:protein translocase subunit SecD [Dehalococcoidia bacterium]|nr:protein translocase subunit SecD [Dehalococcoidia bacterium]
MFRNSKGIFLIIILVIVGLGIILTPKITIGSFERGEKNSPLGLKLGLDLEGGTHLVYKFMPQEDQSFTSEDVEGVRKIVEKRVNEFGVSEPNVQLLGSNPPDRLLVQLPGQKGLNLTLSFNGNTVQTSTIENFFRDKIGISSTTVSQNEDTSYTVNLEDVDEDLLTGDTTSINPETIQLWQKQLSEKFPVVITFSYINPDLIEDKSPSETESKSNEAEQTDYKFPTIDEVKHVFDSFELEKAEIEMLQGAEGTFSAVIYGLRYDGQISQVQDIKQSLRELGNLQFFFHEGDITQWTVGGGIQEAKRLIGSTAMLEFKYRECGDLNNVDPDIPWPPDGIPQAAWEFERCNNPTYYNETATEIDASDLVDAYPDISQNLNKPIVQLVFNDEGGEAFYEVTDRIAREDDRLAVFLDGDELVAPYASTGIAGGRAFIEGPGFTSETTRTIAIQLRSGALPLGLELTQERNVDALLGEDSLRRSLVAGSIGMVILLVFMVSYYRIPGVVSALALFSYAIILLSIFKILPVVLTLSGAAAVILSLGFAVDANVLIAERTKEELRAGRGLLAAINTGFDRAWPSIRDGNLSTIIVASVLFWFGDRFGTSIMQGFALTLVIGVMLSMFTAFFASRVFLRAIASTPVGKKTGLFMPVSDEIENSGRS